MTIRHSEFRSIVPSVRVLKSAVIVLTVSITGLQAAGCAEGQTPEGGLKQPDFTLNSGRVLTNVFVDTRPDGSLMLFYSTGASGAGCEQTQAEVREVWSRFLRQEAERKSARDATIMPEDSSGTSTSYRYLRGNDDMWREHQFGDCK